MVTKSMKYWIEEKYIQDIHHEVLKQKAILDTADTITVATQVGKNWGFRKQR